MRKGWRWRLCRSNLSGIRRLAGSRTETEESKVDIVMDDLGLTYSRVQIQCKNIKYKLQTKHIAREVVVSRTIVIVRSEDKTKI